MGLAQSSNYISILQPTFLISIKKDVVNQDIVVQDVKVQGGIVKDVAVQDIETLRRSSSKASLLNSVLVQLLNILIVWTNPPVERVLTTSIGGSVQVSNIWKGV